MTTTSAPARSSRRSATANGRGSRAVSTRTVVPGRDGPGDHREQPLERHGGVGREPGEQVEDPLRLARATTRPATLRDPRLRARVARGQEPERDPPVPSVRASDAGDHVQRLDLVVAEPGLPGRAVDVWTSRAIEHLAVARRLEALGHRLADAGARAGVDPADRVARRVRPDAGEPRRVLGEAGFGAVEVAPAVGRLELRRGDRPRPDEERVESRAGDPRRPAGERVADREVHGPDA